MTTPLDKTITDYTAAVTIDGAADFFLIEQGSVYKKINRNVAMGISSAPLGTTDSQSPTNKTFNNTNAFTIKDGSFTLQNTSDTSKQLVFSLSSITTSTTRTITVPDASGTMVLAAATQTLTNKTLTSPTITGGTIDNTTITVDSIAGHSSSTVVTVANLQISNGVLNSNNSVVTANVADSAITPAKLQSGTGSGWSYSTWSISWTNFSLGNGTVTSKYIQTGKMVEAHVTIVSGSTTSVSGAIQLSLPVTSVSYAGTAFVPILGSAIYYDASAGTLFTGASCWGSTTTAAFRALNVSAVTYANWLNTSASIPMSWAVNDELHCQFTYEAA